MSQSQQNQFVVKDSGKRIDYPTGARRDTDEGKPRYDLISHHMLTRVAHHLRKGAEKYGDRNWEKGIPTWRLIASGLRHVYQYIAGDRTEDHLSAIIFNFGALVHFEEIGGNPADASNTNVVVPPSARKVFITAQHGGFDVHTEVGGKRYFWGEPPMWMEERAAEFAMFSTEEEALFAKAAAEISRKGLPS